MVGPIAAANAMIRACVGLFFGLFDIVVDIFGNEFPEQFLSATIMSEGEFRSADPARFENEAIGGRADLRDVPGDTGYPHWYLSVNDHRFDFGADFNFFG